MTGELIIARVASPAQESAASINACAGDLGDGIDAWIGSAGRRSMPAANDPPAIRLFIRSIGGATPRRRRRELREVGRGRNAMALTALDLGFRGAAVGLALNLVMAGLTSSAHAQGMPGAATSGAAAPGPCFRAPDPTQHSTAPLRGFRLAIAYDLQSTSKPCQYLQPFR